jgi:hypothetical protein
MNAEGNRLTLISAAITIVALIAIIFHIMMPTMMIDSITLWLLVIAIVPWFVPLIKSIKLGSLEFEFWERLKKIETDAANMHTEMDKMAQTVEKMKEASMSKAEPSFVTDATPPRAAFVHIADVHNIESNYSIIDNPLTNNNPNAILMVTQNWIQPAEDKPGVYNAQSIGVWYIKEEGKWSIFNQVQRDENLKNVKMPQGTAFNGQVLTQAG